MGQRLPNLPQGWADLVVQGNDKRYIGAANASAAGTEAFTRGIQQGLAGVTTDILRKKAQDREDAHRSEDIARSESHYAQDMALRQSEAQDRHDTASVHSLTAQIAQMNDADGNAQPITDPNGGVVSPGEDPAVTAQRAAKRAELMKQLDVVTQRMVTTRQQQGAIGASTKKT